MDGEVQLVESQSAAEVSDSLTGDRLSSKQNHNGNKAHMHTVTISFRDIGAKVSSGKEILRGITGTCYPYRLLCIMGSSGAGKTTLLDILAANRLSGVDVSGEILINGKPRNDESFRRGSCYVLQRDVLPPTSTVYEALMISALLKLPRTMKKKEKLKRVDNALQELGLENCRNVLVGDELLGIKVTWNLMAGQFILIWSINQ